jgi:hypothetical protein
MTNLGTMGKFNSIKYFIHPKYEVSNQYVMSNDDYVVLEFGDWYIEASL